MSIKTRIARGVRLLQSVLLCAGLVSLACSNSKTVNVTAASTADTGSSSLDGGWTVTGTSRASLAIIPSCRPIKVGSVFQFAGKSLEVYLPDSTTPCGVFGVRSKPGAISLVRDDMVWLVNYELKANTLQLTSNAFFTTDPNDTIPSPNNQSATSGEVVVTLTKN